MDNYGCIAECHPFIYVSKTFASVDESAEKQGKSLSLSVFHSNTCIVCN